MYQNHHQQTNWSSLLLHCSGNHSFSLGLQLQLLTQAYFFSSDLMHTYEVRPRKDKRGVDLISDALPFGGLWYLEVVVEVRVVLKWSPHSVTASVD